MKRHSIKYILFLFFLMNISIAISAETKTIIVYGKGDIVKKPDVAYVIMYIKESGILLEDAFKNANQKAADLQKSIQDVSKDIQKIEITDIRIGEKVKQSWNPDEKESNPVPEVIKQIRVTLKPDPILAQKIVDTGIRNGAILNVQLSDVITDEVKSAIAYGLANYQDAVKESQKQAIEKATAEAESLAKLAGQYLGSIKSISCSDSERIMNWRNTNDRYPTSYISVSPDAIHVTTSITLSFGLQ